MTNRFQEVHNSHGTAGDLHAQLGHPPLVYDCPLLITSGHGLSTCVSVHICFNHGLVLLQAWDHWPQWGVAVTDQVFEAIIPRLTWEGICSGWNFSVINSLVNLFILTGVRVCTCIMTVTYIRLYQMIHKINSSGLFMFIVCTIINKQNHIHIQCSIKF